MQELDLLVCIVRRTGRKGRKGREGLADVERSRMDQGTELNE